MKLQILVPQYKETDDIVKGLLDSLLVQQAVDFNEFGVIIVNDGTDVELSESLLNSYPFKVEYYKAPHRGVSATRNTCLDYATADYVMFCDADDMFYNACGLYMIFREINIGFDTLSSKFIEEAHTPDGQLVYIDHDQDATFVHGKIHRRQYLLDNEIRWNPDLTIHEDSYFNVQCQIFTKEPKYLGQSFYLWRWRDESVCRNDPKYILKTFSNLVDSIDSLIVKLEKHGLREKSIFYTNHIILNAYYELNKPDWRKTENIEYLSAVELRIFQFFVKYREFWIACDDNLKKDLSRQLRDKALMEGMMLEELTINQWLDKIINTYKDKIN